MKTKKSVTIGLVVMVLVTTFGCIGATLAYQQNVDELADALEQYEAGKMTAEEVQKIDKLELLMMLYKVDGVEIEVTGDHPYKEHKKDYLQTRARCEQATSEKTWMVKPLDKKTGEQEIHVICKDDSGVGEMTFKILTKTRRIVEVTGFTRELTVEKNVQALKRAGAWIVTRAFILATIAITP